MLYYINLLYMEYYNVKNISFNLYTHFLNFSSEPSGTPYYFWRAE